MKNQKQIILSIILVFILTNAIGQTGQIVLDVKIGEKSLIKTINDSIISKVLNDDETAYEDKDFFMPLIVPRVSEIVSNNHLKEREIYSIEAIIKWDAVNNLAIITGYAPIYKGLTAKPLFFIVGNLQKSLDKTTYTKLKSKVRAEFFSRINSAPNSNLNMSNLTARLIEFSDYNCIRQVSLTDLPISIFGLMKTGVDFYEDASLSIPISFENAVNKFNLSTRATDCIGLNKVIFAESWSDSTIVYKYEPDADCFIKKPNSIGVFTNGGQALWISYDDLKKSYLKANKYDEYQLQIYELLFQSSFFNTLKLSSKSRYF